MARVSFEIAKVDDEQRLVFGLASVAVTADGKTVEDLQGDEIDGPELEAAQYDYVMKSRTGGTMHEEMGTAKLVESFAVTPEKLAALSKALGVKFDAKAFKGSAAWVGYKVTDDETWAKVKSGEIRAFSIGGSAEVEDEEAA